jgi:hypothetical protein
MAISDKKVRQFYCILSDLSRKVVSFNNRNIIEGVCLLAGIKKVLRLVVHEHELTEISKTFEQMGLHVERSAKWLRTEYTTPLGDSFTSLSTVKDKDAYFVVMIAKNKDNAIEAIRLEDGLDKSGKLEKQLGYPGCCYKRYNKISNHHDWLTEVLLNTPLSNYYSLKTNKIAYLLGGESIFYDYFPCSMNCNGTKKLAQNIIEYFNKIGLSEEISKVCSIMKMPIIIRNGFITQFQEYEINIKKQTIIYDVKKIKLHIWKIRRDQEKDLLWISNRIAWDKYKFTIYSNERILKTVHQTMTTNRLFAFN